MTARVALAATLLVFGCTPLMGQPDGLDAGLDAGAVSDGAPSGDAQPVARAACMGEALGAPGGLLGGRGGWQRTTWTAPTFVARTLLADGRGGWMVAAYGTPPGGQGIDAVLLRLNADGRLDTRFGDNGYEVIDAMPGRNGVDVLHAATQSPQGHLLFAGWNALPAAQGNQAVVVRLRPDGTRDDTFGTDGVAAVSAPEGFSAYGVLADGEDTLLVGTHFDNALGPVGVAARLDARGVPDPSFGVEGRVTLAGIAAFRGVVRDGDGYLLLTSTLDFEGLRPGLLRLLHDGTVDNRYGTDGRRWHREEFVVPIAMHREPDGAVVLLGPYLPYVPGHDGLATLVRLTPSGPDVRFGEGGRVTSREGTLRWVGTAQHMAAQCDGALLVLSTTLTGATVLQRFRPDGALDAQFGRGGSTLLPRATVPSFAGAVVVESGGQSAMVMSYTAAGEIGVHRVAL